MLHWCQNSRRRSSAIIGPGGGAADHQPAAAPERAERVLPARLAHAVDDDVGAPSAGEPPDLRHDVGRRVVDRRVRAQAPRGLELGVGAAGDDGPGAEVPGDLERRHRHAAADAPDEHGLARRGARARVVSIRHAVSVASENAAAWAHGIPGGTGARFSAGTTTYSAAVPARCSPTTRKASQSDSSPSRHAAHAPQERPGLIMTRSPGRTVVTAGPTASTTPAPSEPTMWGKA